MTFLRKILMVLFFTLLIFDNLFAQITSISHIQGNQSDTASLKLTENGSSHKDSARPDSEISGQWSDVIDAQIVPIQLHLLPTGKVMFWTKSQFKTGDPPLLRLWDPATLSLSTPPLPAIGFYCSGHAFMADGGLLVAGGEDNAAYIGLPSATIYDPFTNSWTLLPDMNGGRWYPTNTTLSNGDVLVISGTKIKNITNILPQVWQTESGTWRDLTGAQNNEPHGYYTYPWMFLAADGRIFKAGQDKETWFLDTSGSGSWTQGPSSNSSRRIEGSAVMYDAGKILIVGGEAEGGQNGAPTATAEVIDLNQPVPAWRFVAPLEFSRRHANVTLLADGKVLATGGTSSSGRFNKKGKGVLEAEMWDPETEIWSTMAAMQAERIYHSTAILLPDGRVIAAGGTLQSGGGYNENFEIYSPPYLFKGPRPTITFIPVIVNYGQTFFVQTPQATTITNVNLIRLGSVTHSFNQNQRINKLNFSQTTGGLSVTAPANGNLAPPGHYMLFILEGDGVPSIAPIIQLLTPAPGTGVAEIDVQRPAGTSIADGGADAVGNKNVGTTTVDFMIDNSAGTSQLSVTGVTAANLVNASSFSVTTGLPFNIAAGASAVLQIQFGVDAVGAFSFDMDMTSNDGDESPYDIAVFGTGIESNLVFLVDRSTGEVFTAGSFIGVGADLAERINVSEPVEAGDVMELDPARPEYYRKARGHNQLIAGVITTEPGFILGNRPLNSPSRGDSKGDFLKRPMLALMGRVPVKATTENGAIRPGDFLTVSSKPGYAMRCSDAKGCEGTIIGKALDALESGEGLILVLVMTR